MNSYIVKEIAHRMSGNASLSGGRMLRLAYKLAKQGLVTVTLVDRCGIGHNRSNVVQYKYKVMPTAKGLTHFTFPKA